MNTLRIDSLKLLKEVLDICQDTPQHKEVGADQCLEARRLEDAIQEINDVCDDFLSRPGVKERLANMPERKTDE